MHTGPESAVDTQETELVGVDAVVIDQETADMTQKFDAQLIGVLDKNN